MLHVILLILKILGIIFLIIAGLLLLILCSVLFAAVSYRVQIEKHDAFRVSARAGWLFRIITVHFSLDSADGWKQRLQIRLFGFPVWDPYREKKPKMRRKKRRKNKKVSETETVRSRTEDCMPSEPAVPDRKTEEMMPYEPPKADGPKPDNQKSFFRKVIYAIKGICDKIKHIKKKIWGARDSINELLERKDVLLEFWNLEEHRRARSAVFKEVRYLWKKYRPKRIEGKITFGFDDPSVTGLCMGGVGMLCAWYPDTLQIIPDFEQEILEGNVLIKGKARFYVSALILWRVYFNQDIRHMYEHWKQL